MPHSPSHTIRKTRTSPTDAVSDNTGSESPRRETHAGMDETRSLRLAAGYTATLSLPPNASLTVTHGLITVAPGAALFPSMDCYTSLLMAAPPFVLAAGERFAIPHAVTLQATGAPPGGGMLRISERASGAVATYRPGLGGWLPHWLKNRLENWLSS